MAARINTQHKKQKLKAAKKRRQKKAVKNTAKGKSTKKRRKVSAAKKKKQKSQSSVGTKVNPTPPAVDASTEIVSQTDVTTQEESLIDEPGESVDFEPDEEFEEDLQDDEGYF